MKPLTTSEMFPKSMPVICKRGDCLDDLNIKGNCFAFMIMYEGYARFELENTTVDATAPCMICFDETCSPKLIKSEGLKCDSVYFIPTFINVNMTFKRIHSKQYSDIASKHDMFLLMPFTDKNGQHVYPLFSECIEKTKLAFNCMARELECQRDWYWSCRSRSYFMELIFILECSYGYIVHDAEPTSLIVNKNNILQNAILFIKSNYQNSITLSDIAAYAVTNNTTLTSAFRSELNTTPVKYLWEHRIRVAKKQLEFTNLPIKDISKRCGFKTTPHFCRKFEDRTGMTPVEYRTVMFNKRIKELG